jgi:hypothetical protein
MTREEIYADRDKKIKGAAETYDQTVAALKQKYDEDAEAALVTYRSMHETFTAESEERLRELTATENASKAERIAAIANE